MNDLPPVVGSTEPASAAFPSPAPNDAAAPFAVNTCSRCGVTKPVGMFNRDSGRIKGVNSVCKECRNARRRQLYAESPGKAKARQAKWYRANPEKERARVAAWRKANPEKSKAQSAAWRKANPEKSKARQAKWRKANPDKARAIRNRYAVKKRKEDVGTRLRHNLRSRLNSLLRGRPKASTTMALVGCSIAFLKEHLVARFQPGMSWENYGKGGWDVDHARPCASFDLTDPAQQRECFHYSNLQPMWHLPNLKKSDKWDPAAFPDRTDLELHRP